ncbi:hypothetical protein RYH80_15535 [Halobaculum sp. MBLA0147]|uniref:hypothetical protein n=1 Tax=Halobaculum sp. MBLA0147 TaxID=3079934 RepID=UPI003525C744
MRTSESGSDGAVRACVVRLLGVSVAVAALCTVAVAPAAAHDVTGSRFAAPLPLPWLLAGAGATVAVTALWLGVTDADAARLETPPLGTVGPRITGLGRVAGRGLFLVAVLAVLASGFFGRRVATANFATVFTWPVWFRGLAALSVLVGSPWPALSPWRTLYDGLCRLEGGEVALAGDGGAEWTTRLGHWPALLGVVLLVGVVETLTVIPRSPPLTAAVVAGYGLFVLGGAVVVGPIWFDRADPLAVLYRLFGRVAPVRTERTADGGLVVGLRSPWRGCLDPAPDTATVVTVVAAVYTVSFDGFANTRVYQSLAVAARGALGVGPEVRILLYALGLAGFVATFYGTTRLVSSLGGRAGDGETATVSVARAFAPTVLPIAAAYEVAHNYTYVIGSLGRLVAVASDPVLAGRVLDPLGWLPLPAFWGSQVVLIVVGHLIAVVAAHRVAVTRFRTLRAARRGHVPLTLLMIAYTVVSLWIVSRPVVGG